MLKRQVKSLLVPRRLLLLVEETIEVLRIEDAISAEVPAWPPVHADDVGVGTVGVGEAGEGAEAGRERLRVEGVGAAEANDLFGIAELEVTISVVAVVDRFVEDKSREAVGFRANTVNALYVSVVADIALEQSEVVLTFPPYVGFH